MAPTGYTPPRGTWNHSTYSSTCFSSDTRVEELKAEIERLKKQIRQKDIEIQQFRTKRFR